MTVLLPFGLCPIWPWRSPHEPAHLGLLAVEVGSGFLRRSRGTLAPKIDTPLWRLGTPQEKTVGTT